MTGRTKGYQPPLIPLVTRPIPPWTLFDGDAALRSDAVRRLRGRAAAQAASNGPRSAPATSTDGRGDD